jgi:hypothetical protein
VSFLPTICWVWTVQHEARLFRFTWKYLRKGAARSGLLCIVFLKFYLSKLWIVWSDTILFLRDVLLLLLKYFFTRFYYEVKGLAIIGAMKKVRLNERYSPSKISYLLVELTMLFRERRVSYALLALLVLQRSSDLFDWTYSFGNFYHRSWSNSKY